ncbi:MAG TPA: acyl-CoA dehydrogenase C-terminal domain-containing protein [Steroidobacteraceae bacterium]|nr:acyl-CoA dehydrogenase C-terminal domain-containing protein [Steroidobacteraceae bacterium]
MYDYRAPRREFEFVLHEVLEAERVLARLGREDIGRELIDSVIDEGAKFAETVLSPINWRGDWDGARYDNGAVAAPEGFKAAYQQFCRDGWAGMAATPDYGGQGLPAIAHIPVGEMLCSAAMAWRMASGLSEGAVLALTKHGSDALKARFLEKLVRGEWTGTMCLTEPQAGTDLGILRTRAEPASDGSFRITGTKIFISWGEHDLTENIVHLVLARLPDAAPGTRGISLFLVPKRLDGQPNGVHCDSIEHKMGIHGSPTCVLSFDAAQGWMIGQPGGGLACMFTMMNHARLGVGLQGLGLSERALQASVRYAFERLQGRSARGPVARDKAADPIIAHADVRRMVMTQKALTEGQRMLAYYTYMLEDVERLAGDAEERARASQLVAFLVPIVKSLLTDSGMENASLAVQVHGGSGFIRETGVEQYLRDAKIACIYEGTNGIQALDFLGRKVLMNGGATLKVLAAEIAQTLAGELPAALKPWAAALTAKIEEWAQLTRQVGERVAQDPEELGAVAVDYLNFGGYVLLGWAWLRMARVASAKLAAGTPEKAYYEGKLAAAAFYFERLLPRTLSCAASVRAGGATLPTLTPEHYVA